MSDVRAAGNVRAGGEHTGCAGASRALECAPMRRLSLLFLSLALTLCSTGCGGSGPAEPPSSEPRATAGNEPASPTGPRAAPSPWADTTSEELVDRVRLGSIRRIREVDPELAIDGFQRWRVDPHTAPELGGRVSEEMLRLASADFASSDLDGAAQTVRLVRAKARNRNLAFAGTTLLAVIARRSAGEDVAAQQAAVAAVFRELPRARFGASTIAFQIYQDRAQVDAALEQARQQMLTYETAGGYLFVEHVLGDIVANRQLYLDAIATVRAENEARPAERDHRFSTVDLTRARDAQPVLVAVWDTGTERTLFAQQLFANAAEQPNGQDDDGNSIVDDIHGVIADPDPAQTDFTYRPSAEVLEQYAPFLRGIMDLRAGLATTEAAQRVLELMRSATDAASLDTLELRLDQVGEWAHGTHVAGIMLAGLPQARLAIFRSAWVGETRIYHHRGPTDQELAAERANADAIVAFVNAHRVRVVNASIGFALDYLEDQLRHESGVYSSDDQVRRRAADVHAHRRETWRSIFERCPETLFVVAAGNANRDVVEYGDLPGAVEAPNLLLIGAVDRWGNWSTFTSSSPERVRVFDLGVEVESVVPSGDRVPLSGTSMASPNAANLAAKMISVDPALTPDRVIRIITETGEAIAAPFSGVIAHEERALARTRRERGRAGRAR
jgi:hypothetical protein